MTKPHFLKIIKLALAEDLGKKLDLTASLVPIKKISEAYIMVQQQAVICGIDWVTEVFSQVDQKIKIKWLVKDGDLVSKGTILGKLKGPARSILSGERTALNFLQLLSSTATLTKQFVVKLEGSKTKLLDTRKTIPGFRMAQKYAVRCGGGCNHRLGLYDSVLIKENHIAACGSVVQAISQAKKLYPKKTIEVEVKNLKELREALKETPDIIMLDNFALAQVKKAIQINQGRVKLELSGGVNLDNIGKLAKTGVDFISVGTITKTVIPIELTLLFTDFMGKNDSK